MDLKKLEARIAKLEELRGKSSGTNRAEAFGKRAIADLELALDTVNRLCDYLEATDNDYTLEVDEISENLLSVLTSLREIVPEL